MTAEWLIRHIQQVAYQIINAAKTLKLHRLGLVTRAEGDRVQMFDTLARGVDVYRRYLVVAAVLVCAASVGGVIQRRIRRS